MMDDKTLKAKLRFVMPPTGAQTDRFKDFIASKYNIKKEDVSLELEHDTEVLGGFILHVGEDEYDWSLKGRAKAIKQEADKKLASGLSDRDIISVIKHAAAAHEFTARGFETGHVVFCGNGTARIEGP